ncbi:MAG TPA: hypothetical protein VGG03_22480 [Thermoanaerobaculia bacterium]|jgi:hypothetical protein
MSLISEALKKARQEAARQDALHQRVPYAMGAADPPARRNPLLPVLAGLGAGCLVGGLVFAVSWMAGWGPFARPDAPAPQVAQAAPMPSATPAAPSMPPPAAEVREETPVAPPAAPVAPPQPQATAPATPPPAAEPRTVPAPTSPAPQAPAPRIEITMPSPAPPPAEAVPAGENPPAPVETAPATPATPTPAPSPAPAPGGTGDLVDGKVYTGEVPVPGGGSVKLNGIAFSQDRPVAVLDGRVMGPGESIQGFTIVEIEAGRVKLQGHGATVFLAPN